MLFNNITESNTSLIHIFYTEIEASLST